MTPLLAFTFLTPWIAWAGAAAATGPIIIHILNRRRFRLVEWAAMRFLLDSQKRNRRRLQIEELILLALRCLLILLIAFAIAGPQSTKSALPGAAPVVDHCFILDDSASMGVRRGEGSVFADAVAEIVRLIEEAGPADQIAIYRTSDRGKAWQELGRPEEIKDVIAGLRRLTVSDTSDGLAETIAAAAKHLTESEHRKKAYLLGDFRRRDFVAPAAAALRDPFAALTVAGAELILIDHGPTVDRNLTVEKLRLLNKHAIVGDPAVLAVTIRNHGERLATDVRLAIGVDGVERPAKPIESISAGQSQTIEVPCIFTRAGQVAVEASLPSADTLAADNTAHLAVEVRPAIPMLLVDGHLNAPEPELRELFLFGSAMDPTEDNAFGLRPERLSAENIGSAKFSDYDLVVLANVPDMPAEVDTEGRLSYPTLQRLEQYVRSGGGLIVFTGDRINLNFYNDVMFADGNGLSPLLIRPPVGNAVEKQAFVNFSPDGIGEGTPVQKAYGGEYALFTKLIRFYRYNPASESIIESTDARVGKPRVLIRFQNDERTPAIVERMYGDGKVVMVYTTAGRRWNDWGGDMTYLGLMNDMVTYLSRERPAGQTGRVGQPISQRLPGLRSGGTISLKTPAFPEVDLIELQVSDDKDAPRAMFGDTRWAGIYRIAYDGPPGLPGPPGPPDSPTATARPELLLVRNLDPAEGEMIEATQENLTDVIGRDTPFVYLDRHSKDGGSAQIDPVRKYWRWFLMTVLGILALEVFLAQRFGHYAPTQQSKK